MASCALADEAIVGKTEAQLLALKGPPLAKAAAGHRVIYTWEDVSVMLQDGKVVSLSPRLKSSEFVPPPRRLPDSPAFRPSSGLTNDELRLQAAKKHLDWTNGISQLNARIGETQKRIDKYNSQSGFKSDRNSISSDENEANSAQLAVYQEQLAKLESNPQ